MIIIIITIAEKVEGQFTNSRSSRGGSTLDGSGATKENETGAEGFSGSNGSEGVTASRPRSVIVGVPICLKWPIRWRRVQPWL